MTLSRPIADLSRYLWHAGLIAADGLVLTLSGHALASPSSRPASFFHLLGVLHAGCPLPLPNATVSQVSPLTSPLPSGCARASQPEGPGSA
eukprot:1835246-Rhodomonas_salina.1